MVDLVANNLKEVPLPKNTVAVAREDGRIYIVDFTECPQIDDPGVIDWDISVAKLLLSKIQMTRTRLCTLEEVEIENINHTQQLPPGAATDTAVTIFGTLDGKNEAITVTPKVAIDDGGYILAKCRVTAVNFGIQVRGSYNINTIVVTIHNNGRR